MRLLWILLGLASAGTAAPVSDDAVFLPDLVSTPAAEVRIAFSPDGQHMLWGSIGRDGPADAQDIWESRRTETGWSPPRRASFDTASVEFDPAFSPDGRRLYFHSDRPGGLGGTDIYVVDVDPVTGAFSAPRNAGPGVNSAGDEWAPTSTRDGRLIFASDGWGGFGHHDLFEARLGPAGARQRPVNLGPSVNGRDEDFDATLTADGNTLLFSSGVMEGDTADVHLYRSRRGAGGRWQPRTPLGVGCSDFTIGASLNPADRRSFYYAANCPGGSGRMDIRRVPLPR